MTRIFQLCLVYLQEFQQLSRTPAFEPYFWFLAEYYGPKQCAFLILIHLKHYRKPQYQQEALSCVDDYLEFMAASHNHTVTDRDSPASMTMNVLIGLRGQLYTEPFGYTSITPEPRPRSNLREMMDIDLQDLMMSDG